MKFRFFIARAKLGRLLHSLVWLGAFVSARFLFISSAVHESSPDVSACSATPFYFIRPSAKCEALFDYSYVLVYIALDEKE